MLEYASKNKKIIIVFLAILFFGICIGRFTKSDIIIKPKVLREDGYKYIKPILLCNTDNQQAYNEDLSLSKKISTYISNVKSGTNISVYFLSLVGGKWASVNEDFTFSPASMLKVPTVVDALKYNENNPETLSKEVYYDGSFDNNRAEYFKPQKTIEAGKYYSVDDLLKYTISYSDNNAVALLHKTITPHSLDELYKDLKIDIPNNKIDFMNARTYSLFLRVLYNSTYLNREMSEKVLKLMMGHNFPIGLYSGIPNDVEIAQKFGERQVFDPSGNLLTLELHDCGIIYYKDSPYILCVMTSGNDFNSLATNISDISRIVYNHVNQ